MSRLVVITAVCVGVVLLFSLSAIGSSIGMGQAAESFGGWTKAELQLLASLRISALPAAPKDLSNSIENLPAAVQLGKQIFSDPRFSRNGRVACASCHDPQKQFQDGLALGQGIGTGSRRAMPLADIGHNAWFFWDGRKDSL